MLQQWCSGSPDGWRAFMGPKTDDRNASFKSLKLFPPRPARADSQLTGWFLEAWSFFTRNTHRKGWFLISCVSRFQTLVGRSNHKKQAIMGTKETCLYIHIASSPCGKLAVLPASAGKLSPRGLTGCSCIAVLCVRYVPFVVHSLCCLAATCSFLARWCSEGGALCCLFHCFILSNQ